MTTLSDPELLHVLRFTDDDDEAHLLFIVGEKTAWFGNGGFEFFVSDVISSEDTVELVSRIASGPSFMNSMGVFIFGGDRATVFLPDPYPYRESQRLTPELYWFWPSGTLRRVLEPLKTEEYELLPDRYEAYKAVPTRNHYIKLFQRKQLVS